MPAAQRQCAHFNRKERQTRTWSGGQTTSWLGARRLTVHDGVLRILAELQRMGVDRQDVIISTNVPTRLDGMPRSGAREPDDSGAAVYWKLSNQPMRCMAIDRYTTVADNLAAIAATLDAMRAIERHGGAEILDRTFRGFAALPGDSISWRTTLGFQPGEHPTPEQIEFAFRGHAQVCHPDKGGDPAKFRALIAAREAAKEEVARG